jgi:hypothetical protein
VLGIHTAKGKFVFALCRTCAEVLQTYKCYHTVQERALEGVWVTPELELALEHGYKILKIYEIWDWGVEDRTTDLYKGYLQHFCESPAARGRTAAMSEAACFPSEWL